MTGINEAVHDHYWDHDHNCASTTLKVLAERFGIELNHQVIDSAIGMHGAGGYQAQCGLVEGALMFIGIFARAKGIQDDESISFCKKIAGEFESNFGSLQCKTLRPEGFKADNPPHLCEALTCKAIEHNVGLISNWLELQHINQKANKQVNPDASR